MIVDAFYAAPALLILALGIYTTVVRDTFPATVGYLAYGLLLTVAWVQLHGVDVALTEAAIGGGLTGMLLVRASAKLRSIETQARAETPSLPLRLLAALMSAGVAGALAIALLTLPDPAPTLAPEVRVRTARIYSSSSMRSFTSRKTERKSKKNSSPFSLLRACKSISPKNFKHR